MDLGKLVKKAWKWWQGQPKGTRLIVYFLLIWEVVVGLCLFLGN